MKLHAFCVLPNLCTMMQHRCSAFMHSAEGHACSEEVLVLGDKGLHGKRLQDGAPLRMLAGKSMLQHESMSARGASSLGKERYEQACMDAHTTDQGWLVW